MPTASPTPFMMSLPKGKCVVNSQTEPVTDTYYSKVRTRDMGGQATNQEFTRAILESMEKAL
jgi:isocitrate/isopropylmalate dehydrogenase